MEVSEEYLSQSISEEWLLKIGAMPSGKIPDHRKRQWYRQFLLNLPGHRHMRFTVWHYARGKESPVDAVIAATSTNRSGTDFFPWPTLKNRGMLLKILEILEPRRTVSDWVESAESGGVNHGE